MRSYTDADIDALKAKHALERVLELELPDLGFPLPLKPFTSSTFARWVDEDLKGHTAASDAALTRHVLFYAPAELSSIRRKLVSLSQIVVDCLCADAGFPIEAPARSQVDDFDDATPPGVIGQAGLDEAKAEELLAELAGVKAKIVSVIGREGELLFACVVRPPGDGEKSILERARDAGKGYADACRSAADGCIVWSTMTLVDCWAKHPAIVVLILAPVIADLGGSGSVRRFRSR
jgi:hypothetical protein